MNERKSFGFSTQNTIPTIIFLVLAFIALFWIARGIFTILAWLAPIFLIITLIINHKIVINYGKWLWNQLTTRTLYGVIAIILTIIGFPVVSFLLFGRALLERKARQLEKAYEEEKYGTYADYEIVNEEPLELQNPREKDPVRQSKEDDTDEYEQLFR